MKTLELSAIFDTRASFYGKARIRTMENGDVELISYSTTVSRYSKATGSVERLGKWSQTTSRHQKEFERQIEAGYIA